MTPVKATQPLPLLNKRFPLESGLLDEPELTFSAFLDHVGPPSPERYEEYAVQVMHLRNKISGRLKVQVACDVCRFLVDGGYQTRQDLLALGDERLSKLVLDELVPSVRGMGPVLGRYLLLLLGLEQYVEPDTLLSRLIGRIGGWQPKLGDEREMALIQNAISAVATELGTTPARLDNALWLYESTGRSSLPQTEPGFDPSHPLGPRNLAQEPQLASRRQLLGEETHVPLLHYIRDLRVQVQDRELDIPDLDPLSGGARSQILYLLEAPGPKASQRWGGSGFVSMDNDDPTAQTIFRLSREAGIGRDTVLMWNIVPWYVGDGERIRPVSRAEIEEGREHLSRLLALLPELQVVITLGEWAAAGWTELAPMFPQITTLPTWHAGGQALNAHPERRRHVLSTFRLARHLAEYADEGNGPRWASPRIHP